MNRQHRPPWWRVALLAIAIFLAACRGDAAPTADRGTPNFIRPTPGSPTIRGTVTARVAPPTPAPNNGPDLAIAEATLLVDQAVGLLLDYSLTPPTSGDLYQAAYDAAIRYLAQRGTLIERTLLPLTGQRDDDAPTFRAAYRALAALAPGAAEQRPLAHAAIRGAVGRADQCQTYFLAPEPFAAERASDTNAEQYGGIGVTLRQTTAGIVVSAIYPDSPAATAGLRPGDRLTSLDGVPLSILDATTLGQRLRGPTGTVLQLGILRPGEAQTQQITLVRAPILPPVFTLRALTAPTGPVVLYLQLGHLTPAGLTTLREAVAGVAHQQPQRWIIDLRGATIGSLDLLPALGGLFVSESDTAGILGYVTEPGGTARPIPAAPAAARPASFAILIDGGTMLLGEAFAAVLRATPDAQLFGEPTAGCVATSALYPLADGAGLRITLDPLLAPDRSPLHTSGLRPDTFVLPDPSGASDPALATALRWLQLR